MKRTINEWEFRDAFINMDRDYYSYEGYKVLFDYYTRLEDDCGEEMELDVIAICCDCTEYEPEDMINDYGYLFPLDNDYMETIPDDFTEEETREQYLEDFIKELERHTTILEVRNGNYIVFSF